MLYAFNNFLFKLTGVHFVKQRAKNEAVSDLTDGFLLSNALKTSSWMVSNDVWNENNSTKQQFRKTSGRQSYKQLNYIIHANNLN